MNEVILRWGLGDLPVLRLRVPMGGLRYSFVNKYNARTDTWEMDILSPAGVLLVSSVPLYTDLSLLEGHGVEGLPPGKLFVRKVSDESGREHPGRDGWKEGFQMVYQPAEDE